jgi:anti-sigma factor RsiW
MNCKELGLLMSDYVDGRVSPKSEAQIQMHLRSCDGCKAELTAFEQTVKLVAHFEPRRLSSDFDTRLFQRIEMESAAGKQPARLPALQWHPWARASAALQSPWRWATAVAVAAAGLLTWQLYPANQPPVTGRYVMACVQAHSDFPAHTHEITTTSALPDADLANEDVD